MQLEHIRGLVEKELLEIDAKIMDSIVSTVPLTQEISMHLIHGGGKRIRPLVLLLAAKACNQLDPLHLTLAAIVEFIHSATLLHDDVVDDSKKRRGKPTANTVWGNAAPVLVGDFLYSRAFQMMVSVNSMKILGILSEATNIISEGEVLQLAKRHDPSLKEEEYTTIIHAKTAKLFEVAAQMGALSPETLASPYETACQAYGLHLGMAFQLMDDVLDYQAPADLMGKNVGDDLAEGKITLPLLLALQKGSQTQKTMIIEAIRHGTLKDLSPIQEAIQNTGAMALAMKKARDEVSKAKEALEPLPESPYKQAMLSLADFAVNREA